MEHPELRAPIPDALDTVERVMATNLWQRAMAAGERPAVLPLAVKLPRDGGRPRILHGVIELANYQGLTPIYGGP